MLYRGFLCKRFGVKFGIVRGVILQAVLFGLMHNALYFLTGLNVGFCYSHQRVSEKQKGKEKIRYIHCIGRINIRTIQRMLVCVACCNGDN